MESSGSCADTKPQIKRLRLCHVWIEPTKDSHRERERERERDYNALASQQV